MVETYAREYNDAYLGGRGIGRHLDSFSYVRYSSAELSVLRPVYNSFKRSNLLPSIVDVV